MKKILLSILCAMPGMLSAQVVLSQNFDANDWTGTGANQFVVPPNTSATSGTATLGTVTYQGANGLRLSKTGGTSTQPAAIIKKNLPGVTSSDCLVVKFDAERISTTENVNVFTVQLGNNFSDISAAQEARSQTSTNTTTFAELGISFPGTADPKAMLISSFSQQAPTVNGTAVTGRNTIYWVVNKSANTITYTGPDGSVNNTIPTNTWDAWIGGVKQIVNKGAMQPAVTDINDIKFAIWNGGVCEIEIDNISVRKLSDGGTLPVSFSQLSAKLAGSNVLVNWATASEQNNDHFEIEGSTDGKTFKTLKTVASKNGNSSTIQQYQESVSITDIAALLAIPALLGFVGFSPLSRRRKLATLAGLALVLATSFVACQKEGAELLGKNGLHSGEIASGQKPVYIRIKQVDKNGDFTYSSTVVAK